MTQIAVEGGRRLAVMGVLPDKTTDGRVGDDKDDEDDDGSC
jgi:hypothetical protein